MFWTASSFRKVPLLPSADMVHPLGNVWDVLLPGDACNRKLSVYDAYVTRQQEVLFKKSQPRQWLFWDVYDS